MKEVLEIINQIKATSSRNEKETILKQHKDNEDLRYILDVVYNPYIILGIKDKKLKKMIDRADEFKNKFGDDFKALIEYLKQNNTGRDYDVRLAAEFLRATFDEELYDFYWEVITKDLKIGVTAKSINKAFGEQFIPQFDVMLADKYVDIIRTTNKKTGEKKEKVIENWRQYIGKRIIATKKLDGNRALVFVRENGKIDIYSREGHKLEGFVEIEEQFRYFPKGQVYDGEMLATNEEGLKSKDLFRKTSQIIKTKGKKRGLEFHAFDLLPIEAFEKGGFDVPCEKRKCTLRELIWNHSRGLIKYVEPLYIGEFDKELIDKLAEEAKVNEEEGIMVQLADAPYQCKRTKSILKVKSFMSADLRCVDIYEGKSGKNIGRLGGIIVDYKGNLVKVGGGFSDEERTLFWKNKDLIVGKIVEITFFEEFEDDGKLDLRFAQFKCVRDDKTDPSYY